MEGAGMLSPSNSIERLSKGQNNWQKLEVKMPTHNFDLGAFQISDKEIVVFGGFSEGSQKSAHIYETGLPGEGSFKPCKSLEDPDFFLQNGVYIAVPNTNKKQYIFNGHTQNHLFDFETCEFKTLQMK